MTRASLALTVALLATPLTAYAQGAAPAASRDGWLALGDCNTGAEAPRARRSIRERLSGLGKTVLRTVPGLRGLAPPTTGRFRLGVLLVGFSDVGPAAWGPKAYEQALFSRGAYSRTPSGDVAHGSMADYYLENSSGALQLEGRVFDWVTLPRARAELEAQVLVDPTGRDFFSAAIDAVLARDGRDALDDVDALAFVIAGPQARRRGSVLWPHSTALVHGTRAWRYYLMHASDGRGRFEAVGIHCHEFGHVLGLLDKYGVGRRTGLGQWCAMAQGASGGDASGIDVGAPARGFCDTAKDLVSEQVQTAREWMRELGIRLPETRKNAPPVNSPASAGEARPLHLCAVCKERLGWTTPVVIDPRRTRRIYLTGIERDAAQVARVLLDPSGRESLVLEHRQRVGFDADLPRGGLLVWRVGDPTSMMRTFVPFEALELVPAHGVRSTDGALRSPLHVPFPTAEHAEVIVAGRGPGALRVRLSGISTDEAGRLYVEVGLAGR